MKDLSLLIGLICAYMSQGVHKTLGGYTLYGLYAHLYELLSQRHIDAFDPDLVESQMNQVGSFLISLGLWFPPKLHVPLWHKLLNFSNSVNVLAQGVLLNTAIGKYLSSVGDTFNRYAIMAYNYELSLFQEKYLREQIKTHEKDLELRADAATEAAAIFAAIEATEAAKVAPKARRCLKCRKLSGPDYFCPEHNLGFLILVAQAKRNKYCVFCKNHQNPDEVICKKDQNPDEVICKKCTKRLLYAIPRSHIPGQVPCGGPHNAMWCAYLQNGFKTPGADCCQGCNRQNDMVKCNGRDGKRCMHGENGKRYADRAYCGTCNKSQ